MLGDVSLADTGAIVQQGGDAAEAWGRAQRAVQTIQAASNGWLMLAEIVHFAPNDPRFPVLRIAAVDFRTWVDRQLERQRLDGWQLVLAGLTPSLATADEYCERVKVIEDGHARVRQAHENAERGIRQSLSSGAVA